MKYISTRGQAPKLSFKEVLLEGLARDGGLYMPETIPCLSPRLIDDFKNMSYEMIVFHVMRPYVEGELDDQVLKEIIQKSYQTFHHEDRVPLKSLDENLSILELFHGPTLAFKDVALQMLGHLFDWALTDQDPITIIGATSGDTGSAAIEGCRDREKIRLFILHPHNRVSHVQRKQMTTVLADNIFNIGLEGTFDDCQNLVKALFNDEKLRHDSRLSAINSINWARICAQIPYYFYAASRLKQKGKDLVITVPTGNFGNVFAGILAKEMGAPIDRFIIATNKNDSVHHFLQTGDMRTGDVQQTLAPSMDIQISSNFERLLFLMSGKDHQKVKELMNDLSQKGAYHSDLKLTKMLTSYSVMDKNIEETIATIYKEYDYMVDPHTATGVFACLKDILDNDEEAIYCSLGCAHPSKFPDVVSKVTNDYPSLPDFLSDLFNRQERLTVLANDQETLNAFIRKGRHE